MKVGSAGRWIWTVLALAFACAGRSSGTRNQNESGGNGGASAAGRGGSGSVPKGGSGGTSSGAGGSLGGGAGEKSGPCGRSQDCAPGETCVFGECLLDPRECRPSQAVCASAPPTCSDGEVASIVNGCWGECVPLSSCNYLEGCELCEASGKLCLKWEDEQQPVYRCADAPAGCDPPECSCLGDDICGTLTCLGVEGNMVTCLPLPPEEPDAGLGGTGGGPVGPGGGSSMPGPINNAGTGTMPPEPSVGPVPEVVKMPESGSYLDGRGSECGPCAWRECDAETAVCLATVECSHWHGCLLFCAGREGDALGACQLACFNGDAVLMQQTLGALGCIADVCCSQCGAPCP